MIQVVPVNGRNSERRYSLGHGADQFHPVYLQRKHRCSDNASDYNEKRDRFVVEKNFPKNEERERNCSNHK